MRIIEAAKQVIEANKSLKTGALQYAIAELEVAVAAHDNKINLNRSKKLSKKAEEEKKNVAL